jgi:hypothetical protein
MSVPRDSCAVESEITMNTTVRSRNIPLSRSLRGLAIIAGAACALYASVAAADCSAKARALGKCPPPSAAPLKAKSNAHLSNFTTRTAHVSKPPPTMRRTGPGVGPGPIEHSGTHALNPQPIPPGHLRHPLPPPGSPNENGGP